MSNLGDILNKPIAWRQPQLEPFLRDLPANILKGHGRPHSRHVFLRFPEQNRDTIRAAISHLPVTSALDQLLGTEQFRMTGRDGGPVVLFFLSATGYAALGVPETQTPSDPAFRSGMIATGLDDNGSWEAPYRQSPHAMLLVADNLDQTAHDLSTQLAGSLADAGAETVATEIGAALFRDGQGVEHFGYVDGRSQPLMLEDEVIRELNEQGEPFVWDPQFGPAEMALVSDPGGTGPDSFGSYFVFRKLEQNVARFREQEAELGDALQLMTPEARSLAGALIVGRFKDGTPVVQSKRPLGSPQVANNFIFPSDPQGGRCPFQAHIRKTNPRGDSGASSERLHLMPRRGIPYGERAPDLSDAPTSGVGLLFMAYNQDIARQFAFTQHQWADNPSFARPGTGRDPIIGRGDAGHRWPKRWDDLQSGTVPFDIAECVTVRGGEYFFAPSLGFLRGLGA